MKAERIITINNCHKIIPNMSLLVLTLSPLRCPKGHQRRHMKQHLRERISPQQRILTISIIPSIQTPCIHSLLTPLQSHKLPQSSQKSCIPQRPLSIRQKLGLFCSLSCFYIYKPDSVNFIGEVTVQDSKSTVKPTFLSNLDGGGAGEGELVEEEGGGEEGGGEKVGGRG